MKNKFSTIFHDECSEFTNRDVLTLSSHYHTLFYEIETPFSKHFINSNHVCIWSKLG